MIYSKIEPRVTIFRKRRLPFWTSSIWHFENRLALGYTLNGRGDDYIHIRNGEQIARTRHSFHINTSAEAHHWLMDGTPIGMSKHLGRFIEHHAQDGRMIGVTEDRGLKNGSNYVHRGDGLSIAHYGGGVILLLRGPHRSVVS